MKLGLRHFHNREEVASPFLETTLQLDVTRPTPCTGARMRFARRVAHRLLYWRLLQPRAAPLLHLAAGRGELVCVHNLPLYFRLPWAAKSASMTCCWKTLQAWLGRVSACAITSHANALQLRIPFDPVGSAVWSIAVFIGNLPNLQFTSFSIHGSGRPRAGLRFIRQALPQRRLPVHPL